MNVRQNLTIFVFCLLSICQAQTPDSLRQIRMEAAAIYHLNGSLSAEYAFAVGRASSIGMDVGASYGVRDAWNSLSLGTRYYPFSVRGVGPFARLEGAYGFDEPWIQGDAGTDIRASLLAGYRAIVFGCFTGTIGAGANYDHIRNAPAGTTHGLNPAVEITLGIAIPANVFGWTMWWI
jgi:hypothetical protein